MGGNTTRKTKTRRGNGEGSIYQESNGRWVGAISVGGKRRRVIGATRAEARDKLAKLQRAANDGLPVGDGRVTVGQWMEHWLTDVLPGRPGSPNTVANYTSVARQHILPAVGGKRLRLLTPEDVESLLCTKAEAGYSRNTVMRIRAVLGMALRHAEKRGRVGRNVASLADMPACRPQQARRSLTQDQAATLLAAARSDRLEALWVTGLMLGLRPGELAGLTWVDIDFEHGLLHIRQARLYRPSEDGGKQIELGELKTTRARRSLDLPSSVVEALKRHKSRQASERLSAGPLWSATWASFGLVFTTELGTPLDPSNLRRQFHTLTEQAGLGKWKPYELRHSAASLLSAAGVHAEHIGDVLGHDGTRMVATVYRHAVTPTVNAAVAPMEAMFGAEADAS